MTYFEVLGVSTNATDGEITAAYYGLARKFHPDAHPGASYAERQQWEQAMARINEAHDALKDRNRRSRYEASLNDRTRVDERFRAPSAEECVLCGSWPAAFVRFERQTGLVITRTVYSFDERLCRQCGLAMGRAQQSRTLATGWWGIISFFVNFAIIFRNATNLRRVARLTPPSRDPYVVAPLSFPMAAGRSVFARPGAVVGAIVLVGVAAGAIALSGQDSSSSDQPTVGWEVGNCISGTDNVAPVECDGTEDGEIVDLVGDPADCPDHAESYVTRDEDVYCIETY